MADTKEKDAALTSVFYYGDIEEEKTTKMVSTLHQIECEYPGTPIILHINSPGGSLYEALDIYDRLRSCDSPVITIASGCCSSAALLLLLAGEERYCMKNTAFFYHQPVMSPEPVITSEQVVDTKACYEEWLRISSGIMRERTNLSAKAWKTEFDNRVAKHFFAEDALKWGFVHKIIPYTTKKKKKNGKKRERCTVKRC